MEIFTKVQFSKIHQ